MSLLATRCFLIGSAVVLVLVGVLADLVGAARAVLLVAAGCCAVLDAVTVRSTVTAAAEPPPVVPVDPSARHDPLGRDAPCGHGDVGADVAPGRDAAGTGALGGLLLGRRPDGHAVQLRADGSRPCHVVVIGVGAVAEAVFAAVTAQLEALEPPVAVDGAAVRTVTDEGPVPSGPATVRALPPGTAVTARIDASGQVDATVVLVPGVHLLPRRWDHLVEVTRHGCRSQAHADPAPSPIEPVLPLLVA